MYSSYVLKSTAAHISTAISQLAISLLYEITLIMYYYTYYMFIVKGVVQMLVILINSPLYRTPSSDPDDYLPPLGLGYIATAINETTQNKAIILDAVHERLGINDIVRRIDSLQPDYVGINVFSPNYELVREIAEKVDPRIGLFIGGPATKSLYMQILEWETACKVNIIIGEGERIIPSIINGSCAQEPCIERENKRVFHVGKESRYYPADISDAQLDRSLFKERAMINHYGELEAAIVTSRGCPFNCAFCGGARSLNRDVTIRTRTENSVVREIEQILSLNPEVKSIRVLDDLFLRNSCSIDEAVRIFKQFQDLNWRSMAHAIPIASNKDRIRNLRDSGCRELFMGIESGSARMRQHINKAGKIEDVLTAAQCILDSGIDLKGYFIYGFPTETERDFEATYELACRIADASRNTPGNFRTSVFQFRPYHGTKLFNELFGDTSQLPSFELDHVLAAAPGRKQLRLRQDVWVDRSHPKPPSCPATEVAGPSI